MEAIKNRTVLVVEDDDMNVIIAKKLLQRWEIHVLVAANGVEAIDIIINKNEKVDLILMDIHMPLMSGYAATEHIRNTGNSIPILALTASAMDEIKEKIMQYGMDDYILKPINPEELLSKLIRFIPAA